MKVILDNQHPEGDRAFFVWLWGLAGPGRIAVVVVLCTAVGLSLSFCVDGVTGDNSPFPERLTDSFFLVFFIPSDTLGGGGGGGGGDRKQARAAADRSGGLSPTVWFSCFLFFSLV